MSISVDVNDEPLCHGWYPRLIHIEMSISVDVQHDDILYAMDGIHPWRRGSSVYIYTDGHLNVYYMDTIHGVEVIYLYTDGHLNGGSTCNKH